jgi:CP family cyanate transporter-like MFS transporter
MNSRFALLWLAGLGLRVTMLALPPVLPLIHRDLRLSESGVAILSNLPVLMLAGSSIFGSLLVARLGARTSLVIGLWIIALSSAFRGAGHSIAVLFTLTFVMGFGIAIIQPAFPALSRQWFPTRVPLATSIWANGLLVGEALSASLTLPLVLPLAGGRWEVSFMLWGALVAFTALVVVFFSGSTNAGDVPQRPRWLPDLRDGKQWQLGLLQSAASVAYFGANAFLPDYLHVTGQDRFVGPCLAALNIGQLPASLALGLIPMRIVARTETAFILALSLFAAVGGLYAGGPWAIGGAALTGFCGAFVLVLSFAVPALSAAPADVARLSAGMYTIGYTCAFLASLAAGALWDATHAAYAAFLPIVGAGAIVGALGPRIGRIIRHAE